MYNHVLATGRTDLNARATYLRGCSYLKQVWFFVLRRHEISCHLNSVFRIRYKQSAPWSRYKVSFRDHI